ncbi:cytochrome P450 [Streptomyces sp. NPDC093598]|uniref:cytochrome P450 n=1 Tax=Streptomyces sp. NPDC093598 TaxID=3366046 RepID=UPI00381500FE
MSEETVSAILPPVRDRPAPDLSGGEDRAWLVTRLRRSVAGAFTVRGVERVRERSRHMLTELVDEVLQDGPPADLTEAVLSPFPTAVICELMGIPAADRQGMHAWTRRILSPSHGAEAGEKAGKELGAYFSDLIGLRGGGGGEDVVSLLGAAVGRGEVTLDEAVGLAVLLQIGCEAAAGDSGRLVHVLLTRPELAERLRAEPEIRPRAVEELLRGLPHRHAVGLSRITLEDGEIRGPAANPDPNPHVSFGFGPHCCPGGMLARLESELLVDALLDGVPGLRLAVPAEEVPFRNGTPTDGPEALPVTW